MSRKVTNALEESRQKERAQILFYRALAVQAEEAGDAREVERLNALLADEQHHYSRITARILELGGGPLDDAEPQTAYPRLSGWEEAARSREEAEVAWYEGLMERDMDDTTRTVLSRILESERHHARELSGKWTMA